MEKYELEQILEKHKKWLCNMEGGERANLCEANLSEADLRGADLSEADLCEANLSEAYLRGADLSEAKSIPFIPTVCPEVGAFIGFKKSSGYIVELEILADAKRSSATTRKCRCDKAQVISITSIDGQEYINTVASDYDHNFIYKVGKIVKEPNYDENRWNECSTGIHFFINRQEAVEY